MKKTFLTLISWRKQTHVLLSSVVALFVLSSCFFYTDQPASVAENNAEKGIKIDTVVSGLKVPWGMAFLPNGDMLVTERGGQLRMVKAGKLDPTPIKGVPEVVARGQGGLLDVFLHPKFTSNGLVYITYSAAAAPGEEGEGANTAVMRARLDGNQLVDQKVIFKATPNVKGNNHFGSRIAFDKQGYLYVSIGERGQMEQAQNTTNHQGTVIRLHDDGRVPADNPFVGKAGFRPEIYSYGHRNPQGMMFHPKTGELWANEHGPQGGDELNLIKKGANYGWPSITYGINYDNSIITKDTVKAGLEQPVLFWRPSIAPSGMAFISGKLFKGWEGDMLVGSMKFGYIEHLKFKGNKVTSQTRICENIGRVRDLREGPDGAIYVAIEGPGLIVRLTPAK